MLDQTLNLTIVDRSGELSRIVISPSSDLITDGILDQVPSGSASAFLSALASVIDGTILRRSVTTTRRVSNARTGAGQREEKWLVIYQDNTTLELYQCELPTRKTSLQPPIGTDKVDLTIAPWSTFKSAFESAVSPNGNSITVLEIRLIGRNL